MIKQCVVCEAEFDARGKARSCSKKCSYLRMRQKHKDWMGANPEKCREYGRRTDAKYRDKKIAYNRRWREENSEKYAEGRRRWLDRNIEYVRKRDRDRAAENRAALRIVRQLQQGVMP